jgi:hypothetical protein
VSQFMSELRSLLERHPDDSSTETRDD